MQQRKFPTKNKLAFEPNFYVTVLSKKKDYFYTLANC